MIFLPNHSFNIFSNEEIESNYNLGEYKVDLYFPGYNIAVQIYEVNDETLNVKNF